LENNIGYGLADMKPTMKLIAQTLRHFASSPLPAIRKKYGGNALDFPDSAKEN
jgi:hypothetical protein